jgi:hypothetical protein
MSSRVHDRKHNFVPCQQWEMSRIGRHRSRGATPSGWLILCVSIAWRMSPSSVRWAPSVHGTSAFGASAFAALLSCAAVGEALGDPNLATDLRNDAQMIEMFDHLP